MSTAKWLLLSNLALAACVRSPIYHPTKLPRLALDSLAKQPGWQVERLAVAPGLELVGLESAGTEPDAPWMLFFGGNAMGLPASQAVLTELRGGVRL